MSFCRTSSKAGSNRGRRRSQRAQSLHRKGRRRRLAPPGTGIRAASRRRPRRRRGGTDVGCKESCFVRHKQATPVGKTCAEDAPERKVVVRGKLVNASAEAPFAVQHLLKPAPPETCASNSEATSNHLHGPQREPGAANQGQAAARTRPRESRATSQRSELVGRNTCSRSAEMYALRRGR